MQAVRRKRVVPQAIAALLIAFGFVCGCANVRVPVAEESFVLVQVNETVALTVPFSDFADAVAGRAAVLHARVRSRNPERLLLSVGDGSVELRARGLGVNLRATHTDSPGSRGRVFRVLTEIRRIALTANPADSAPPTPNDSEEPDTGDMHAPPTRPQHS